MADRFLCPKANTSSQITTQVDIGSYKVGNVDSFGYRTPTKSTDTLIPTDEHIFLFMVTSNPSKKVIRNYSDRKFTTSTISISTGKPNT